MDCLDSCYRGFMKFAADSDEITEIQWYFTDQNNWSVVPSPYVSRVWDNVEGEEPCPVGEVPTTLYDRVDGKKPAWVVTGPPCGTAEQWQGGINLADMTTVPCRCGGWALEGTAGLTGSIGFLPPPPPPPVPHLKEVRAWFWVLSGSVPQQVDLVVSSGIGGAGTVYYEEIVFSAWANLGPNIYGYDIWELVADVGSLPLAAGTYWLTFRNGIVSGAPFLYWDESGGPSAAWLLLTTTTSSIASESFQLFDGLTLLYDNGHGPVFNTNAYACFFGIEVSDSFTFP